MPDLSFHVDRAEVVEYSTTPMIAFKLQIHQPSEEPIPIHSVMLRCQIRIEPTKRRYVRQEQDRLLDLFDTPDRWSHTLRSMLWTHTSTMVPGFTEPIEIDLPVPCTFDFNVATTKYFHALEDGEVPLILLFSGTVFYEGVDQTLQVEQISWDKEATFRLPIRVWKEMMEHYYPNTAWLRLRRDVFDRLSEYKSLRRLPTWEQAMEQLLLANVDG